jgi:Na+-transporting methylmalonyl-CoA/oxaloacetate decarboxylase beta subunit
MNSTKKQKISLLLLRLSAVVFGVVTLLECSAAVILWMNLFTPAVSNSTAVIGGADGPTEIYISSGTLPMGFVLFLFALPPILLAGTLILIRRCKKQDNAKNTD